MKKNAARLAFYALPLCFALGFSAAALAAPVDGCDQDVLDAMNAKANARVAYDVAATEQTIDKPDSILAMSCFSSAAGNSSKEIGSIFSGDITTPMATIIPNSLEAFYDDFAQADGNLPAGAGPVKYTGTTALNTNMTACTDPQDLWTKTLTEGIQKNIPFALFDDLKTGNVPTGQTTAPNTTNFYKDWTASKTTDTDFSNLGNGITTMTTDHSPTIATTFSTSTDTVCQVMAKATPPIAATCPP